MIKLSVRFDLSLTQKQGALHLDEAARRHRRDTAIVDGIIGTAATGTKAPTKISAPPTISTAIVAQAEEVRKRRADRMQDRDKSVRAAGKLGIAVLGETESYDQNLASWFVVLQPVGRRTSRS